MICFDTALLIWGVQCISSPNQKGMVGRTSRYLQHLDEIGEQIIVPAPAVAEYLCGFDPEDQTRQRQEIESVFRVPSFDADAAGVMAELGHDAKRLQQIRRSDGVQKQAQKFDLQVIAIAILNGADRIVTHDVKAFKKMAKKRIEIIEVPDIPRQKTFDAMAK